MFIRQTSKMFHTGANNMVNPNPTPRTEAYESGILAQLIKNADTTCSSIRIHRI